MVWSPAMITWAQDHSLRWLFSHPVSWPQELKQCRVCPGYDNNVNAVPWLSQWSDIDERMAMISLRHDAHQSQEWSDDLSSGHQPCFNVWRATIMYNIQVFIRRISTPLLVSRGSWVNANWRLQTTNMCEDKTSDKCQSQAQACLELKLATLKLLIKPSLEKEVCWFLFSVCDWLTNTLSPHPSSASARSC